MTARRLLTLVDGLPPESLFKSAVEDRPVVSETSAAIGEVVSALTGKQWQRWGALKRNRDEAEFQELVEQERAEARAHNTIYLEAQRARS